MNPVPSISLPCKFAKANWFVTALVVTAPGVNRMKSAALE